MHEYNTMPEDLKIIENYKEYQDFFSYCIESQESRNPRYSEEFIDGHFKLIIFWIKKEKGLGFGIAQDWKNKKIIFYKFGSEEKWNTFNINFASQFKGDNS